MQAEEAKRLTQLEKENARLKKLLAEAELEKAMLKEPVTFRKDVAGRRLFRPPGERVTPP